MRGRILIIAAFVLASACDDIVPRADCGDRNCEFPESEASCPDDCSTCGDGRCAGYETARTCDDDCTSCGDKLCTGAEDTTTCPQDCTSCGDGRCAGEETQTTCVADCPRCGDKVCGPGENETNCLQDCCVPDCTGRSCGMDPKCNTPCGEACDDSNRCTSNTCNSSGTCEYPPFDAAGICINPLRSMMCTNAQEADMDCVRYCLNQGVNAASDCSNGCVCTNYTTPTYCSVGTRECTSSNNLAECFSGASRDVQNFWHIQSCSRLCREAGFASAQGCSTEAGASFCTCYR